MRRACVTVVLAIVFAGGCASKEKAAAPTTAPPTKAAEFTVITDDGRSIEVEVGTADPAVLRQVFDAVRADSEQDAAHVTINCNEGGTASVDNRLANGTYARTAEAAVLVGLDGPGETFEPLDGTKCPLNISDAVPAGQAVTADDIVAAVTAAGLLAPNPRDNTGSNCSADALNCTRLLTTDVFSVHEWATAADAAHWIEVGQGLSDSVLVGPLTTVTFRNDSDTPPYDPEAYKSVFTALASGG